MAKYKHQKKKKPNGAAIAIVAATAAVIVLIVVCVVMSGGKNETPDPADSSTVTKATPADTVTDPVTPKATEAPTESATVASTESATEAEIVTPPVTETPTEAPVTTDYPGAGRTEQVVTDPVVTTKAPETAAPVVNPTDDGGPYEPSAAGYDMLKKSVFIGDSICSGLRVFGVLPEQNVCATGSVSACNIFWYGKFNVNGVEYGIEDAMRNWPIDPEYIIFSMGMNDVNMGSEQYFVDNYKALFDAIRAVKPNAKLAVCSVTPVSASSNFAANEKIDRYNAALKNFANGYGVTFVDVSTLLKNGNGDLNDAYHSGDGIHLCTESYKIMLYSVCRTLGWQ